MEMSGSSDIEGKAAREAEASSGSDGVSNRTKAELQERFQGKQEKDFRDDGEGRTCYATTRRPPRLPAIEMPSSFARLKPKASASSAFAIASAARNSSLGHATRKLGHVDRRTHCLRCHQRSFRRDFVPEELPLEFAASRQRSSSFSRENLERS